MTLCMLRIWRSPTIRKFRWYMVAQVHDELIMEGPVGNQVEAVANIVDIIQDPMGGGILPYYLDKELELYGGKFRVELPVDYNVAHTWSECSKPSRKDGFNRQGRMKHDYPPPQSHLYGGWDKRKQQYKEPKGTTGGWFDGHLQNLAPNRGTRWGGRK